MLLSNALRTGGVATAATTAALVFLGKRDTTSPWAPLDAVSHIAWGDRAFARDELDVKHTLVGSLLNAAAVVSWAAVQELALSRHRTLPVALVTGAATSALAYVVDFHVVPKRLTPGFEWKLPKKSLLATYVVLGAALAVGGLLAARD